MVVTLMTFLTKDQIDAALALWRRPHMERLFHSDVRREIVEPNIEEINRKLGQKNDPDFIAFAIEYVFMQISRT